MCQVNVEESQKRKKKMEEYKEKIELGQRRKRDWRERNTKKEGRTKRMILVGEEGEKGERGRERRIKMDLIGNRMKERTNSRKCPGCGFFQTFY